MKLREAVKPISYLKAHASDILRDIADSDKTYVITQNGEAKAVVQGVESYEQTQETLALLKMLAQSAKSLQEGRVRPIGKAFKDLEKRIEDSG
jgi:prevent-host-death family protein